MTKRQTRRFFIWGTIGFTIVFIALTLHTHTTLAERTNEEALTEQVVAGLHVWGGYNCEGCHTLMGEGSYFAPDLTKIVEQRGSAYLAAFLAEPSAFYSHEEDGRLMPDLDLSEDEIEAVIAFLDWVGDIDLNGWPPRPILVSGVSARGVTTPPTDPGPSDDLVSAGQTVFNGKGGCAACHSIQPGGRGIGPSLAGAGRTATARLDEPGYGGDAKDARGYLREAIVAPSAHLVPGDTYSAGGRSLMPDMYGQTLDASELDALVAYLASLSSPETP